MAMFNFDYNLINNLNTFNYITKDRYLSWLDRTSLYSKLKKSMYLKEKEFKPISINKMPYYCKDKDIGQYSIECDCI